MIFGWSTFKIICNTPIFYQLDVKLNTRWAITGSWEPLVFYIVYKPTIDLPVVYCYFLWLQAIQWLNSLHLLLMLVFYLVLLCVFMFCVVVSVTISDACGCLFARSGVPHMMCCVFILFYFVLCTLCCQFLWIVPSIFSNVYYLQTLVYW